MSELKREDLVKLTHLSRIDCKEEEIDSLLGDLKNILDYIDLLHEVDTSNVQPCNHVLANVFNTQREDIPGACLPREDFLNNAPSQSEGMIRVPSILKSST